jgi:hypothetical protein
MSVCLEERRQLADAIEQYLAGEIDNFALNEVCQQMHRDVAAFQIAGQVWYGYDDIRRHKYEGKHRWTPEGEAMLRRWIQFLRTDRQWPIETDRVPQDKGCLLELVHLPLLIPYLLYGLFMIIFFPDRPKFKDNLYWPYHSQAEWDKALRLPM